MDEQAKEKLRDSEADAYVRTDLPSDRDDQRRGRPTSERGPGEDVEQPEEREVNPEASSYGSP